MHDSRLWWYALFGGARLRAELSNNPTESLSLFDTRNVVLWSSNWALSITIVVKFNSNLLECLLTDDVSGDVDQRARALKQPNDRSSSRIAIPYRLTFTFNLTVRKSSCCILAITPHPCSFFHLRGSIEIRTISLLVEQRSTIKLCSGSSWSNTGSQWSSYRKILFRRFYETLRGTIFSNDDG